MKRTRHGMQFGLLILIIVAVFIFRGNCERWCPFGAIESLYTYIGMGNAVCTLGTSNFFALGGVLLSVLLIRRAFCSHVCPIGTLSEATHRLGRRLRLPRWNVPPKVDALLSLLKYPLLVVILYYTYTTAELIFRGFDPCYALIGRHGEGATAWTYVAAGSVLVASLFVSLPFCRWACPLAVVLNPFARLGLTHIRRNEAACTSCGVCAKRCGMAIPVDQVETVHQARCTLCLECVDACPHADDGALELALIGSGRASAGRRGVVSHPHFAIASVMIACIALAFAGAYMFPLPSLVRARGARPTETLTVSLQLEDMECNGTAVSVWHFLSRDDFFGPQGYLRLEAWPDAETPRIRVTYDPTQCSEEEVRTALIEPYFDLIKMTFDMPKFRLEGEVSLFLPPLEDEVGSALDYLDTVPPGDLPIEAIPLDDLLFGPGTGFGGDLPPLPFETSPTPEENPGAPQP